MVKILGFEINRSRIATEPNPGAGTVSLQKNLQETEPSIPLKRAYPRADLGDSGTRTIHGIISEEYNAQLQGIQGIKVFDEMRKSDGTVRAVIAATTLPVRRAQWFINPSTPDQKDKDIANFVEHALFDWLDLSWDDVIRQALLMVPFGVMCFEKVYGTKDHDGKTYVTLTKLSPRLPKSILQWELPDHTFGIQQVRQDGVIANIPGSKLLIFVNDREGDNWWGTSMLRAAYKHWYYKDRFYKIDAVGFERQSIGIPKMIMPEGYNEADEAKAVQALQNLRASESAYLILPNGYEAEFMNMGASSVRDATIAINHHNKEILQSVLAQFLELGATSSGSGSRALSQDHSDLFLKAEEAIANTLIAEINKNLIPELVDMNFDNVTVYPVLDYSGISKVDVAALGTAYAQLVTAGAITPTNDDQQYLRTMMGLPPRTQDDIDSAADNEPTMVEQVDHSNVDPEAPANPAIDKAMETMPPEKPMPKENAKVDKTMAKKKPKQVAHDYTRKEDSVKRTFSNKVNGRTFMSWRPLTFAEQKVDFQGIQETMDKMETDFSQQAKDLLNRAKDEFMAKLHTAVDNNDVTEITALELGFVENYKQVLKNAMTKAYQYGKVGAADELGINAPAMPQEAIANIDLMADTIANKTMMDIEAKAKFASAHTLKSDTSVLQAIGSIDATLEDVIDTAVDHAANLMIGQGINDGRNGVFQQNSGLIYGLQRSEVLDKNTCDFCLSMDGLVIKPTDDWAAQGEFHENCRGIWVDILTDEQNPPDITGIPSKIGDYYGGQPNDLVQPPKPIVAPGSDAAAYIAQRDEKKK